MDTIHKRTQVSDIGACRKDVNFSADHNRFDPRHHLPLGSQLSSTTTSTGTSHTPHRLSMSLSQVLNYSGAPSTLIILHTKSLVMLALMNKFSEKTHQLRSLMSKNEKLLWKERWSLEFESIKQELINPNPLKPFDTQDPSVVVMDASQYSLGAVLLQPKDGKDEM
ncbi:hypothetical protein NDU88_000605 [Pleurodeles waltl]|uniref:Reverse transcriptase/retrotransposon-derived protein RNase H-like domain-containing protein n=1 Tax=Pleurodeles waltl TaxID=8319 RepID=A0AAV7UTJ9_PLEWA|nr:hypothetical protein NDU88_000605 [Pleurodeles waltl]